MPVIYVTRPTLPPFEQAVEALRAIWDSRILTNNGPFHQEFETALADYLGVERASLVSNGMLALDLAILAAGVTEGEVITTPYSFVATTHSIAARNLEPVFVDILPDTLNIDPELVETAITPRTRAIMAVHCYGNNCAVEQLEEIAARHSLALIYDAAHAFGVKWKGRSLLSWGDYSTLSFHATKAFNTFEGGAVIARTAEMKLAIDRVRNFGIVDEVTVDRIGTNAKMSEFNAAIGLLQLDQFAGYRAARGAIDALYRELFSGNWQVDCLAIPEGLEANYSYFPVLVGKQGDGLRDRVFHALRDEEVMARRYFYPLLANLPVYSALGSARPERLPMANDAADRILCLPIYPDLDHADVERIAAIVNRASA